MNYLVCIKQVPDTTTRFQINENQVNLDSVKWIINPYDEFALEEALCLKEQDQQKKEESKVWVLSLGPKRVLDSLRAGLAVGADEGVHIHTNSTHFDSLNIARSISYIVKEKLPTMDLIFFGTQSIDWKQSATGFMFSEIMGYKSIGPVHRISKKEKEIEVHQTLQQKHTQILTSKPPLVLCITKGEKKPRYPSLSGIMKAKKKIIHTHLVSEPKDSFFSVQSLSFPKERPKVQMIQGSPQEQAKTLIQILREKENIL